MAVRAENAAPLIGISALKAHTEPLIVIHPNARLAQDYRAVPFFPRAQTLGVGRWPTADDTTTRSCVIAVSVAGAGVLWRLIAIV